MLFSCTQQVSALVITASRALTLTNNSRESRLIYLVTVMAFLSGALLSCVSSSQGNGNEVLGDAPAIIEHVAPGDITGKQRTVEDLINLGKHMFTVPFNTLDGAGNAKTRIFKEIDQVENLHSRFNRISGPDANSCLGCHNLPSVGGGGDNVSNAFVLARRFPNVNFDSGGGDLLEEVTLRTVGNERGTISMFGSGIIELLAREMTSELHHIRDTAMQRAISTGKHVTVTLNTKGVNFGKLTAWPDGLLDVSKVQGIDEDLIVKPFSQKGVYVSIREFTLDALEFHHGLQPEERIGYDHDGDLDGVVNELTVGDVTALVLFQASLHPPVMEQPSSSLSKSYVETGELIFDNIGCAVCHKPFLELNSPIYSEPNPYNPPGTISDYDIPSEYDINLVNRSNSNSIKPTEHGTYLVYAYTDLKRHNMGPILANETEEQRFVESPVWITRKLWGFMSEPPFLHHGRATIIEEAIIAHGGEAELSRSKYEALSDDDRIALIEFLKTLQTINTP